MKMFKLAVFSGIFSACFFEGLCVNRAEFFSFYPEMNNLVPVHPPMFQKWSKTLVRCVNFCVLNQDCASIFRITTTSICQGFGNPFLSDSSNVISNGTWYVKSVSDSCSVGGYTWDPIIRMCYKFHSIKTTIFDAKATCQSELARLLLLNTNRIHSFAVRIMKAQSSGSLYIQGSRDSINSTIYLDDRGRQMANLKWSDGEPSFDGNYLRLNTEYYRLEATPGYTTRRFICQRGQL